MSRAKVTTRHNWALGRRKRIAGQDQTLPVGELLDMGAVSRFDDLRIDDLVENPLLDERADVLAPDFPRLRPAQGFVHFVDESGSSPPRH